MAFYLCGQPDVQRPFNGPSSWHLCEIYSYHESRIIQRLELLAFNTHDFLVCFIMFLNLPRCESVYIPFQQSVSEYNQDATISFRSNRPCAVLRATGAGTEMLIMFIGLSTCRHWPMGLSFSRWANMPIRVLSNGPSSG